MSLLSCENVSIGYEGEIVLDNINFDLKGGEYLCIVGENGAGKSTLLKTLLRLRKPMAGEISIGDGLKANEIGYLPQQTNVQKDFPASVFEVVLSGKLNSLGFRPFYSKKDKLDAHEKLHMLGIDSLINKCYNELSGGQQQRVLLARALCATKKMILLDEPVAGLDPIATEELYDAIDTINKKMGITIVMVSHDIEASIKYATHILHLKHDSIFFGKTEDYLETEQGMKYVKREVTEDGNNI